MKPSPITSRDVYTWLEAVKDPEIPVLSLVDLGVITDVVVENNSVDIEMTPTFVGCPALEIMKQEITETLLQRGMKEVRIVVNFRDPWSSDKISEKGRRALKEFGLAPPMAAKVFTDLDVLEHVSCPRCEGTNTTLKSVFGPTLCRSIHYCFDCQESFEQFKPL
ncbi:ring-1,2-phenylacetyl-CoA epoxidase subunit PaaD [Chryseolinea serpens]|uniref:Ring-1,2-phenylacetyl-CoA epoxidase subunit PaaD n=1 Tax=Chryseolinea serpens TaxID=947013 RepID=A0A1M5UF97_9BACT|nr:1,2-phenylacetyl-CoA epoxidase subunit PaaD [Chryseolinea serpens]SHH61516.1 ring-1,2-phenylacetyl-CoA epoxidase subunit PaaD [Chryseolinea serpens]